MNIQTQIISYEQALMKPTIHDDQYHHISKKVTRKSPILRLYCRGISIEQFTLSVLIHLHGIYPYFYALVPDQLIVEMNDFESFKIRFARTVESQLLLQNPNISNQIQCALHDITLVKAKQLTGYHCNDNLFLKIFVSEPALISIVSNLLKNGYIFTKFQVFETHITYFMKFVVDCGVSINQGLNISGCIQRHPNQCISTCDLEFDGQATNIVRSIDEDVIDQSIFGENKISPLKTKSSPQMVGLLEQLQVRRKQFLDMQHHSLEIDEEDVDVQNNEEDNQHPIEIEQQVDLELDVRAFDQDYDGGDQINDNGEESSEPNQTFEIASQTSKTDFKQLYYSDEKDIPHIPFVFAGREYQFDSSKHEDEIQQYSTSSEVVSISSDIEESKSKLEQYFLSQIQIKVLNTNQFFKRSQKEEETGQLHVGTSQLQTQLEEIEKVVSNLKMNQTFSDISFIKVMQIEMTPINDALILLFYNSIDLTTVKLGDLNILNYAKCHVILFTEFHTVCENDSYKNNELCGIKNIQFHFVTEKQALTEYLPQITQEYDPDMIFSWKINRNGVGQACIQAMGYNYDLFSALGRTIGKKSGLYTKIIQKYTTLADAKPHVAQQGILAISSSITGRMTFSIQQCVKRGTKLNNYDLQESLLKYGIQRDIPQIHNKIVTKVINQQYENLNTFKNDGHYIISENQQTIKLPLLVFMQQQLIEICCCAKLLQKIDFIQGAAETSKLFKVPIYEAVTRGSQYKVEAFLFAECRSQNFIVGPSPTPKEVAAMKAMQSIPLVAEPQSGYYSYPVLVFDFASLYPSIICAYNICYSTVFQNFEKKQQIGPFDINFRLSDFNAVNSNDVIFSPAKCCYVKSRIRAGILPKLMKTCLAVRKQIVAQENNKFATREQLQSILQAITLKNPDPSILESLDIGVSQITIEINKLHTRQQELKMLMNTTYGYTGASFSGRMPCQLLADSIVEMSRQSLEYCIKLVEQKYNCDVVYGDTDSMFVHTKKLFLNKNMSKTEILLQSYEIGKQILADINTAMPPPMRIKLERIYMPCILVTKKRYVGRSYNPDTIEQMKNKSISLIPSVFDAKGIEAIRREVPQLTRTCVSEALCALFANNDLSQLKNYFLQYFSKYCFSNVENLNFIFIRKSRVDSMSTDRSISTNIATKSMGLNSYTIIPEHGERVSYIIAKLPGQEKLVNSVLEPVDLYSNDDMGQLSYQLHYTYYLERTLLGPLQRIFGICGIDVGAILRIVALFSLQNQDILQSYVSNNYKFKQLVQYFAKLDYSNVNKSKYRLIIQELYHSCHLILPSYYSQGNDQKNIITKRVCQCIRCQAITNSIFSQVAICKNCFMVIGIEKEYLFQQYCVKRLQIQINIDHLQQQCNKCANLNYQQCSNYKCRTFQNLNKLKQNLIIINRNIDALQ